MNLCCSVLIACTLQEGAFAFVFKSIHYPDEVVICRRGSPVLIGVKTEKKLKIDFVDVEFSGPNAGDEGLAELSPSGNSLTVPTTSAGANKLVRSQSRAFLSDDGMPQPIEFFIASDASAIVEHTKRVLYLEDDDIAHIAEGGASSLNFDSTLADERLQNSTSTDSVETMVYRLFEQSRRSRSNWPPS